MVFHAVRCSQKALMLLVTTRDRLDVVCSVEQQRTSLCCHSGRMCSSASPSREPLLDLLDTRSSERVGVCEDNSPGSCNASGNADNSGARHVNVGVGRRSECGSLIDAQ